jgi:arylsulfatase A-like enzyme
VRPSHQRLLAALLSLAALAGGCDRIELAPEPERPAILLVVLDTVRADHVSSYGYPRPTTPQLDAVAAAGALFEDASASAPWTWPSHASLFTGQPPWVHGAHLTRGTGDATQIRDMSVTPMRRDLPTLAERLGRAGYRTVSLASNRWLDPPLGLTRGFEDARVLDNDGLVFQAAREEIARRDARPLFLFVNLLSAHAPYLEGPGPWAVPDEAALSPADAPEWLRPYLVTDAPGGVDLYEKPEGSELDGVGRYLAGQLSIPDEGMRLLGALYDAGVRAADFGLGRVLQAWVAAHPTGVVAVTSDHGEALGEHGLIDHRGAVYREQLHVPLVLAAPGTVPAGRRVRQPVRMLDLYPTLLELAGVERSPRSLLAVLRGESREGAIVASAWPNPLWADAIGGRFSRRWNLYREGGEALVWDAEGEAELYDLAQDPAMTRDLAQQRPERVRELRRRGATAIAVAGAAPPRAPLEVPEETRRLLRELGYGGS